MQQIEDHKEDHNILAKIPGEEIVVNEEIEKKLAKFVLHVFDHRISKVVKVGKFLGKNEAVELINKCLDEK